ncbi:hypothetical protein [Mycoplasmopsis columbinasalis]|uniref:Uncharacterized protein n=1 Tax=Mycoplasmopsis columbinasalis TaxID=114880 RepID=A0A449BB40_9BACT|nr:hypothetical protein [Mycoplasmopsis columbinasalis]VEU78419.1 Uncharacterised protein [Mycoplasmopsis columbinasalis]
MTAIEFLAYWDELADQSQYAPENWLFIPDEQGQLVLLNNNQMTTAAGITFSFVRWEREEFDAEHICLHLNAQVDGVSVVVEGCFVGFGKIPQIFDLWKPKLQTATLDVSAIPAAQGGLANLTPEGFVGLVTSHANEPAYQPENLIYVTNSQNQVVKLFENQEFTRVGFDITFDNWSTSGNEVIANLVLGLSETTKKIQIHFSGFATPIELVDTWTQKSQTAQLGSTLFRNTDLFGYYLPEAFINLMETEETGNPASARTPIFSIRDTNDNLIEITKNKQFEQSGVTISFAGWDKTLSTNGTVVANFTLSVADLTETVQVSFAQFARPNKLFEFWTQEIKNVSFTPFYLSIVEEQHGIEYFMPRNFIKAWNQNTAAVNSELEYLFSLSGDSIAKSFGHRNLLQNDGITASGIKITLEGWEEEDTSLPYFSSKTAVAIFKLSVGDAEQIVKKEFRSFSQIMQLLSLWSANIRNAKLNLEALTPILERGSLANYTPQEFIDLLNSHRDEPAFSVENLFYFSPSDSDETYKLLDNESRKVTGINITFKGWNTQASIGGKLVGEFEFRYVDAPPGTRDFGTKFSWELDGFALNSEEENNKLTQIIGLRYTGYESENLTIHEATAENNRELWQLTLQTDSDQTETITNPWAHGYFIRPEVVGSDSIMHIAVNSAANSPSKDFPFSNFRIPAWLDSPEGKIIKESFQSNWVRAVVAFAPNETSTKNIFKTWDPSTELPLEGIVRSLYDNEPDQISPVEFIEKNKAPTRCWSRCSNCLQTKNNFS